LSYDVREATVLRRLSERQLRNSEAVDMVLVRHLGHVPTHRNEAFSRFRVPGPSLSTASPVDFKHFKLIHLSELARPRAAFPAIPSAEFSDLPGGVLSPWCCPAVSVFML
jgi:hypothetical protein